MRIRELSGMQYQSIEMEHAVATPMSEVLYALGDWIDDNVDGGILTGVYTQSHPDDDNKFLTQLLWAL